MMIVTASALNVRSGPGTQYRVLGRLVQGERVTPVEHMAGWVWVTPGGGWVSRNHLTNFAARLIPPTGLAEIISVYGEPGSRDAHAGRARLPAPLKVGWANLTVNRFACHTLLEKIFEDVFAEVYAAGHWPKIRTFDGCYNDRFKTGQAGAKSTHAWGIAVDLNAATNQYGTTGDMPREIISIFGKHGFVHLTRDPMHFQYARGY